MLQPGRTLRALEAAARGGALVRVRLEGRPYGGGSDALARVNQRAAARLRKAGALVTFADRTGDGTPALHMKALVCDGVAYLDDRNFPNGCDTIIRDDCKRDARAVVAAANGIPARSATLALTKKDAENREASLLDRAAPGSEADVSTESFGLASSVYSALRRAARRGVHCRLLVCDRDVTPQCRHALALMRSYGVDVRAGASAEKIAVVGGTGAWIGSANATSSYYAGGTIDWGLRTDARPIVRALRRRFEEAWHESG